MWGRLPRVTFYLALGLAGSNDIRGIRVGSTTLPGACANRPPPRGNINPAHLLGYKSRAVFPSAAKRRELKRNKTAAAAVELHNSHRRALLVRPRIISWVHRVRTCLDWAPWCCRGTRIAQRSTCSAVGPPGAVDHSLVTISTYGESLVYFAIFRIVCRTFEWRCGSLESAGRHGSGGVTTVDIERCRRLIQPGEGDWILSVRSGISG
jgi:hypothetical protein